MTMQHNYEYDCFIYHNLWPRTIKIGVHTYNTRNVINLINSIICPNQNTWKKHYPMQMAIFYDPSKIAMLLLCAAL